MPTIRLFGNDIKVEEKSIMLFGKRIFPFAGLSRNNNQQQQPNNRLRIIPVFLPPRDMHSAIESVQGSQPVYIGCKYVENSDISVNLSRFLFTNECSTKLLGYLSTPEKARIDHRDDPGLDVSVMDPNCKLHDMKFTRWKSLQRLVFNRGWNKLVEANHLQKGDIIHLWYFRTPTKLFFAMNIIKN